MEKKMEKWIYRGDVNIEHGGYYAELSTWKDLDYCEIIRIADLDSGCGFTGAIMVEELSLSMPNVPNLKSALDCCGYSLSDCGQMVQDCLGGEFHIKSYEGALLIIDALLAYGYYDNQSYGDEIIVIGEDNEMSFEGLEASSRLDYGTDLRELIENEWDCAEMNGDELQKFIDNWNAVE